MEAAGGGVPVHPGAPSGAQDRTLDTAGDGPFDGALHRGT